METEDYFYGFFSSLCTQALREPKDQSLISWTFTPLGKQEKPDRVSVGSSSSQYMAGAALKPNESTFSLLVLSDLLFYMHLIFC